MRLTLHHFLNVLRTPVMQTPPFRSAFAAFEIEMLHHYYVSTRLDRNVKDEGRRLFGDVVVDALGSSPQSRHPFRPVPLSIADSTECAFQRVFFSGETKKMSLHDSAVRTHHHGRCGVVDAKIHSDDHLIFDVCFVEFYLFFK